MNFLTIFYSIYLLLFCFINLKYTHYGKLFVIYILFFFILIPIVLLVKNHLLKSLIYAMILVFIFQPPYIYLKNYLKKNTINTFQKNLNFSYNLKKGILDGINGVQNISTDKNGFRTLNVDNYNNYEKDKVFFIGGSTTANIFLDDQYIFSNITESFSNNQIFSINAGKDGHTSKQNYITFKYVLENYNPDYVIFLIGANDWTKSINNTFSPMMEKDLIKSFFLQSQPLIKLYGKIYEKIKKKKTYTNATMFKNLQGKYNSKNKKEYFPKNVSKQFSENIKNISKICLKKKNLKCIFMTQPAIYNVNLNKKDIEKLWFTPPFKNWALSMNSLVHLRDLYNNFLLINCEKNNLDCLDLSTLISNKTNFFYDDIHFNKEGNIFIGKTIYEYIKKN